MADIGISIGLQGANLYIQQIGQTTNITIRQMGRIDRSVNSSRNAFQKLGQEIPILGRAMRVLSNPIFAVGAAVTGIGVAFKNAVGTARVFQQQLADTAAIVGIERTDAAFQGLTQSARELGATTEFSATEAAQAMEELARAGFDVNQILKGTPGTLALATVGNLDLAKAADIATNVLSQYGKEAGELGSVVDVLAKTTTTSNTNVTQLADAFNYLGPTAKALGISLEESAAAVGVLANSGLKGSLATRALGTSLVNLTAPTTKAAREIEKIGLSAFDSQGNFVGLAGLVEQLEGAYSGYTAEQRQASLATIFGAEAIQELNILLDKGSGGLREYTDEIAKAGAQQGAFSQQIRETKLDTFEGSLKLLASAWEELQLAISSGSLDFLAGATRGLADGIRNVAGIITGNLDFGDVFGPVGESIDNFINSISDAGRRISASLAPISKAFTDAFSGSGSLIESILVPAIDLAANAVSALANIFAPLISIIANIAGDAIPALVGGLQLVVGVFSGIAGFAGDAIGELSAIPGVVEAATVAFIGFRAAALLSGSGLARLIVQFRNLKIVQVALAASSKAVAAAQVAFSTVAGLLSGKIKILTAVQRVFNIVLAANPIGLVITAVGALVGAVIYLYENNEKARKIIDASWQVIKSVVVGTIDIAVRQFRIFLATVKAVFNTAKEIGTNFFDSIKSNAVAIGNIFAGTFTFDADRVKKGLSQLVEESRKTSKSIGQSFTENFSKEIRDIAKNNKKEIADQGQQLSGTLNDSLNDVTPVIGGKISSDISKGVDSAKSKINELNQKLKSLQKLQLQAVEDGDVKQYEKITGEISKTEAALKKLQKTSDGLDLSAPAKAARGPVAALNDQLTGLNEKLSNAAPTTNTDSIRNQIAAVGRELSQLELNRLGINVDLSASIDPATLTGIDAQIKRVKDEIEANQLFIEIGSNAEDISAQLTEARQKIEALRAGAALLDNITVGVTEGDTQGVLDRIKAQVAALSNEIAEQEVYVNILSNTGGTEQDIQTVNNEITSLKDNIATLEALQVDIQSGEAVNAIQAVKDKADELRGTLDSQQIKIDVLTDTAGAGDSLAAVQSRVNSLISELQGLEGARIDITSGDSSAVVRGITSQIEFLEERIKEASFSLPSIETDPEGFRKAEAELAALQTNLDTLQGYQIEVESGGLETLESRLTSVNNAIAQIPASNSAYTALKEQARELTEQINQVKVFRVITETDSSLPALNDQLDVLEDRLQNAPQGQFFPALLAQVNAVRDAINLAGNAIETIELKPIEPQKIEFEAPEPPDFSGVTAAVRDVTESTTEDALTFKEAMKGAFENAFRGIADGVANIFEGFGEQLGRALRQGKGAAAAFQGLLKGLVSLMLVEVPKMIGTFLVQAGVGLGFPAGLPLILAGAALTGLSGLIGGLLGGGRNNQQQVATPTQAAAQGATTGGVPGRGLSSFQASEEQADTYIDLSVVVDSDGLADTVERRIIRAERNVRGR